MNINATFPAGVTALTVHGLHQWDYGQSIEISCPELSGAFEVHFSNTMLKTAYIRTGAVGSSVAIPDVLLQQPYDILAWVCEVGAGRLRAIHTLRIPITPRPRPEDQAPITPAEQSQFQKMMADFNAATEHWVDVTEDLQDEVGRIKNGEAIVGLAQSSLYATNDANGNAIHATYFNGANDYVQSDRLPAYGLYHVWVYHGGMGAILPTTKLDFGVVYFDGTGWINKLSGYLSGSDIKLVHLVINIDGSMAVTGEGDPDGIVAWYYYKPLWAKPATVAASETADVSETE